MILIYIYICIVENSALFLHRSGGEGSLISVSSKLKKSVGRI